VAWKRLGGRAVAGPGHVPTWSRPAPTIGGKDTLITAHALALDATLVTADEEYRRVPGLKAENWLGPAPTGP
jgi:predicted nucleic acid-binding protein